MVTTEEFIKDFLEHREAYDPEERRRRYLETRKLKGRQSAAPDPNRPYQPGGKLTPAQVAKGHKFYAKAKKIIDQYKAVIKIYEKADTLPDAERKKVLAKMRPLDLKLMGKLKELNRQLEADPDLRRYEDTIDVQAIMRSKAAAAKAAKARVTRVRSRSGGQLQ